MYFKDGKLVSAEEGKGFRRKKEPTIQPVKKKPAMRKPGRPAPRRRLNIGNQNLNPPGWDQYDEDIYNEIIATWNY